VKLTYLKAITVLDHWSHYCNQINFVFTNAIENLG